MHKMFQKVNGDAVTVLKPLYFPGALCEGGPTALLVATDPPGRHIALQQAASHYVQT